MASMIEAILVCIIGHSGIQSGHNTSQRPDLTPFCFISSSATLWVISVFAHILLSSIVIIGRSAIGSLYAPKSNFKLEFGGKITPCKELIWGVEYFLQMRKV